jgi:DNA-binding transcriptional ArsR family regulator
VIAPICAESAGADQSLRKVPKATHCLRPARAGGAHIARYKIVTKPSLDMRLYFRDLENMEQSRATHAFATLGHPGRIAVFRLLMRFLPQGACPSEIAEALGMKQNTLSHHLSDLAAAGLVQVTRSWRSLYYSVDLDTTEGLIGYPQRKRPELGRAIQAEAAIEVQATSLDLRQAVSMGVAVDPPAHQLAILETFIRHIRALYGGQAFGKGDLFGGRPAGGIRIARNSLLFINPARQ